MGRFVGYIETRLEAKQWLADSNTRAVDMALWFESESRKQEALYVQKHNYKIVIEDDAMYVWGVEGLPRPGVNANWIRLKDGDWVAFVGRIYFIMSDEFFTEHFRKDG